MSIVHEDFCQNDRRLDVARQIASDLVEVPIGVDALLHGVADGEVGDVGVAVLLNVPRPRTREDLALLLKQGGVDVTFDGVASGVMRLGHGCIVPQVASYIRGKAKDFRSQMLIVQGRGGLSPRSNLLRKHLPQTGDGGSPVFDALLRLVLKEVDGVAKAEGE